MRTYGASWINERVVINNDDGTTTEGILCAITRRGYKVKKDDGKFTYSAWWRLRKA